MKTITLSRRDVYADFLREPRKNLGADEKDVLEKAKDKPSELFGKDEK